MHRFEFLRKISLRQRVCISSTALNVMIYCFYCRVFFLVFGGSRKVIQLLEQFLKYSLMMLVALPPSCRTAITRVARTVLAQSPASEMNLSTPQAFLTVENVFIYFFYQIKDFVIIKCLNFPEVSHHFLRCQSFSSADGLNWFFRRKNGGGGKKKGGGRRRGEKSR